MTSRRQFYKKTGAGNEVEIKPTPIIFFPVSSNAPQKLFYPIAKLCKKIIDTKKLKLLNKELYFIIISIYKIPKF